MKAINYYFSVWKHLRYECYIWGVHIYTDCFYRVSSLFTVIGEVSNQGLQLSVVCDINDLRSAFIYKDMTL